VGIWTAGSNRVTIQYCESYNNHTKTSTDGGGYDFDWDVTNSTIQYCYSHNNDGPGYIMAAGTHTNSGNVIRYSVSENDGRRNVVNGKRDRVAAALRIVEQLAHRCAMGLDLSCTADLPAKSWRDANGGHDATPRPARLQNST
jgi:hypothetical protein